MGVMLICFSAFCVASQMGVVPCFGPLVRCLLPCSVGFSGLSFFIKNILQGHHGQCSPLKT